MSGQAQVPRVAAAYFGDGDHRADHPVITAEFHPGKGWVRQTYKKRVSAAWCRKLRAQGVEAVALTANSRTADFTIAELVRR